MPKNPITTYLKEIENLLASGQATEHSYRSTMETLVRSFSQDIAVINEPKRIECGAPDLIVNKSNIPLGYIEAKDVGTSLDNIESDARLKNPKTESGKQFKRYLESLNNLILTDYLEFRWFVKGESRLTVRLAEVGQAGKLRSLKEAEPRFNDIIGCFFDEKVPIIGTPKDLASRMAAIARLVRDVINRTYQYENGDGYFHNQLDSFREVLLHDLKPDQFADMYAQTICYGLFTARYNHPEQEPFNRMNATFELPKTNPFLRKMFGHIAGQDLDDKVAWIVDDLAELLNRADMEGILKDFGERTRREDPVVHFYETFLTSYDPNLRETRGVYYTPEPVVSYIVKSIDYILKNDFGIKDGLADKTKIKMGKNGEECHRVLILDPAVGTGTFLYNVIDHIRESFKGDEGMWSGYVSEHLLPRLFGFELLMAPYAVAHMKLALQLKQSRYKFDKKERLNIFLTNTLEEAFKIEGRLKITRWLTDEANEASKVKKDFPVMVILGNPPYSGHSANKGEWIHNLLRGKDISTGENTENYFEVDGKPLGERNPKWLNDDYVKFIRFAQHRIEKTGYGILGFICNHSYLDNPTFRGMRQSLMNSFNDIYILDLHGNVKKREVCPDGSKDENVFDIQQGVAIGLFVKRKNSGESAARIKHYDLWGIREKEKKNKKHGGKYGWLNASSVDLTPSIDIFAKKPFYLFKPRDERLLPEYEIGKKINNIFTINAVGFQTHRDYLVLSPAKDQLNKRIRDFIDPKNSDEYVRYKYFNHLPEGKFPKGDTTDWNMSLCRKELIGEKNIDKWFTQCIRRPFDIQWYFHHPTMTDRQRLIVTAQLIGKKNKALLWTRPMSPSYDFSVFCTNVASDQSVVGNKVAGAGGTYVGPLYRYPIDGELNLGEKSDSLGGRRPNLNPKFLNELSKKVKVKFISDAKGDIKETFGPEDVFNYIYAVFHSPTYRTRYAEFLKIDFPRLPLTSSKVLFRKLCGLGQKLVDIHLMEADLDSNVKYPVSGDNEVDKVRYTDTAPSRVWINNYQYFENIPKKAWEFQIGGYQVCHKWLKDRKGRELSYDDLEHYKYIVAAISETIKLMDKIDKTVDSHGGWPIK